MIAQRGTSINTTFASLAAGVAAGAVAAAAVAAAQLLMGLRDPGIRESAWSAFVACIAGGILYDGLVRVSRAPRLVLWIASLAIAAFDSLLVILLPLPAGHGPHIAIPISGLIVPIRQMAALVGLGHFGTRHFPAALVPADTILHFIPAAAVGTLVPWLAGPKRS